MTISKKILLSVLPAALISPALAAEQTAAPAPAQQGPAPAPAKQAAAPATAQQAAVPGAKAAISAGAKVSDTKGGEVGILSKVDGQFVILKTDKHEARLPVSSLSAQEGGLVIAMSRDELNAEVEKRLGADQAQAPAAAAGAKPQ